MNILVRRPTSRPRPVSSRGIDVARLVLRGAVGGTMIAHGLSHGRALEPTASWFRSLGFRRPDLQATTSAVLEVGAGGALVAGAGVPVATAAVVGTMGVAARTVHVQNGFLITAEGWEYVANLAAASVALSALGGGRYSVDGALGVDDRLSGSQRAAVTVALGLASAATHLAASWRPATVGA